MSVYVLALVIPACKAHPFHTTLYFHVWPVWLYHTFYELSHKCHDFGKKLIIIIMLKKRGLGVLPVP
jgi:hypothetical protein